MASTSSGRYDRVLYDQHVMCTKTYTTIPAAFSDNKRIRIRIAHKKWEGNFQLEYFFFKGFIYMLQK